MSINEILDHYRAPFYPELQVSAAIAQEAGAIALQYHGRTIEVDKKPGNEPVTIADHECSDHIVARLQAAFPNDVIISEESPDKIDRLHAERVWYVDPIDGTKDFIRGANTYCVMIGLAIQHQPVLGVIYQPNCDSLFFASRAGRAWSIMKNRKCEIRCSNVSDPTDARFLQSHLSPVHPVGSNRLQRNQIRDCLGIDNANEIGSIGLKLCTIAAGASDVYAKPSTHCSSWDTCAPQIILQEAGGKMTNFYGAPLVYDNPTTTGHTQGLIASNGFLHSSVLNKQLLVSNEPTL